MHPTISAYLDHLTLDGRPNTARGYGECLQQFDAWLAARGVIPDQATADDLRAYQRYLATDYRSPRSGRLLAKTTQATRLAAVQAYFSWLDAQGLLVANPAEGLTIRYPAARTVQKDYLTVQEATALVQTQAALVEAERQGNRRWALQVRNLAAVCLALATGRRRSGLLAFHVDYIDRTRNEARCEREKGQVGRVAPVAAWAMTAVGTYLDQARPLLDRWDANPFLFVGKLTPQWQGQGFAKMLAKLHQETATRNPDLTDLATKRITPHSLRVSFATMLFQGGCTIRSINELMLHAKLSTTARYTPIPLEDLRRTCRQVHPRA